MKTYRKLVRDRIPEIIRQGGADCEVRTLTDAEYGEALRAKLREEVGEYLQSGSLEELADVMEVVRALARADGRSVARLEAARARKKIERGAFEKRVFLVSVSEPGEEK